MRAMSSKSFNENTCLECDGIITLLLDLYLKEGFVIQTTFLEYDSSFVCDLVHADDHVGIGWTIWLGLRSL